MPTVFFTNRPLASRFLSLFSPARGRGLFCFFAGLLLLGSPLLAQTITTVAGNGTPGFTGDGAAATAAQLNAPTGVAVDGAGNLFIADADNNRIRKVTPGGSITTVAGTTGFGGFSGDGGAATDAQLFYPAGVAVDGSGNLFIADFRNNRARKVTPGGSITTVAGDGTQNFGGDASTITPAQLYEPYGVAVDAGGNLFIAAQGNNRIRKVTPGGSITTVAGTGSDGFSGDGGAATAAQLYAPAGVAVDADGNLFIGDYANHRIRKVTPGGIISTVAGDGTQGFGGDGGAATAAQLNRPSGVAVDAGGNLFIADYGNHRIRKVTPGGIITTVAGFTSTGGFSGDGGAATAAQLNRPSGVAVDAGGNLFIADFNNHRIRKVSAPLTLTTSASPNPTCTTTSMASVTARNGTAPYSYTWVAPAGVTLTGGSTSAVQATAGAGVSGVQTLTVNVSDATMPSQTATAQVSLTFNAPANPSLVASGTLTCTQTAVTLTATTSSAGSFSYAFAGTGLSSPNATAGTATASAGGLYSMTVTDLATGCTSTTTTMVQTSTALPAVSIGASSPGFGCGITSITLTANVPAGATFQWEDGSSTPTREIMSAGTFGLSATATDGCSATATPANIVTGGNTLPTVTMVFNNQSTVVAGAGTATITVPGTPGQQFQVFGGSSFEYGSTLDRTNGYEIRQVESNGTGIFTIKRGGSFVVIVRDGTGCSRTVQGEIVVR